MTSTVSYRFTTTPWSSRMGTALMPFSENMWTTSNTVVCSVAVAIGQYGCVGPRGRSLSGATYVPIWHARSGRVRDEVMGHCDVARSEERSQRVSKRPRRAQRMASEGVLGGRERGVELTLTAMNLRTRYWVSTESTTSPPDCSSRSMSGNRRACVFCSSLAASNSGWSGCTDSSGGGGTPIDRSISGRRTER